MTPRFQQDKSGFATGGHDPSDAHEASDVCASKGESIAYLAQMVAELGAMARRSGLGSLATILGLAKDEADRQLRQQAPAEDTPLMPAHQSSDTGFGGGPR